MGFLSKLVKSILLSSLLLAAAGCEQAPMLSVGTDKLDFSEKGGTQSIAFVANKAWSATSVVSWCKVSPSSGDASDENNVKLTVTCDANDGYDPRSCTVTIRCEDLFANIQVVQGEGHGIIIDNEELEVSYIAQQVKVPVSANVDYQVTVGSGASDWIKVVSTKGLQSGTIVLSVSANAAGAGRKGTVEVKDSSHGLSREVTVSQAAYPVGRVVNPEAALGLPYEGCTLELDIETNVKDYMLVPPMWMYVTDRSVKEVGGKFLMHVVWSVAANDQFNVREGVVTLQTLDGLDTEFLEIKVTQEPLPKIVEIADPAFRSYMVGKYDVSGDGQIDENEALLVDTIAVSTDNIESMDELGSFPNLVYLGCEGSESDGVRNGKLTKLDVSGNPKLEILYADNNLLNELDVSANPGLYILWCNNNNLTSLDVSHNPDMLQLMAGQNNIKTLDLSMCPDIVEMWCFDNGMTTLVLPGKSALKWVWCEDNKLESLDISGCSELEELYCFNNLIHELAVTACPKLKVLWCSYNRVARLDPTACPELQVLVCEYMSLTELDVTRNAKLSTLSFVENSIKSIDVTRNPLLDQLWFGGNRIGEVDLSANPLLSVLHCESNQLKTLDVSANLKLEYLRCDYNPDLKELWLLRGQKIETLIYDIEVTRIKYKDSSAGSIMKSGPSFSTVEARLTVPKHNSHISCHTSGL